MTSIIDGLNFKSGHTLPEDDRVIAAAFWYDETGKRIGEGDLGHGDLKQIRDILKSKHSEKPKERHYFIATPSSSAPKSATTKQLLAIDSGYLLIVPDKSYWVKNSHEKATIALGDVFMRVIDTDKALELTGN